MFQSIFAIFYKDLITEWRTKEVLSAMLIFSLLVVVIFNFAFNPGSSAIREAIPGIIWVAFTFAGILGLNRSFVYEVDRGCLHGLVLSPASRSAIFLGKMASSFLFMFIMELITLPFIIVFFNLPITPSFGYLLALMILGTLGFTAVGTLFSAISVHTKTREIMLPVILFPIVVPTIVACVNGTEQVLAGATFAKLRPWMQLLLGFDIVFLALTILLFEYVIEE